MEIRFRLKSPFPPSGDQPEAIRALVDGLSRGVRPITAELKAEEFFGYGMAL